jgi:hypothetical protein
VTASSSGTPLFISELSLAISLLAAVGWIATALMARVNLQRQIRAASLEAWKREFREQVAQFMAWQRALATRQMHLGNTPGADRESDTRQTEIQDGLLRSFHSIYLLMAERGGEEHAEFMENLRQIVVSPTKQEEEARAQAFATGAALILRSLRDDMAVGWQSQSRLRAWLRRTLPKHSDLT